MTATPLPQDPLPTMADLLASLEEPSTNIEDLSFSQKSPIQVEHYAKSLAALPRSQRAQKLYSAIKEVSLLKESPEQRIKLLGVFHPQIIESSRSLIEKTSVSRDVNKVITLALAMLKYLYSGYKRVIVASAAAETLNTGLLANSIFSAICVINELFVSYWRHHLSPPEQLWQELHTLFRIAQEFGLEDQRISFVSNQGKSGATIESAYLKVLLSGSVCPPRYNAGEFKQILKFIDDWGHLAELSPSAQNKLFLIDPTTNYGAVYRARVESIRKDHLSLCPKTLVSALQDRWVKTDSDVEYITIPDRIADNLCQHWSQENLRQEDHAKNGGPVDIIVGLDDIHQMLAGTEFGEEFFASLKKDSPSDVEPSTSATGHWRYPSFRCEYLDQSESGCCIEADGLREALAPGEVVILIDPETETQRPGVIRWTHNTNELKTRVGIKLFSGELKACAVCLTRDTKPTTPYLPAFTIASGGAKGEVHLFAPSIPLKTHNQVHLVDDQQEEYFLLKNKVDVTFHVSHFKIVPEAKVKAQQKAKTKTRATASKKDK